MTPNWAPRVALRMINISCMDHIALASVTFLVLACSSRHLSQLNWWYDMLQRQQPAMFPDCQQCTVQSDVHQWLYTRLGVDRSPATEPNVKCTYSTMTRLWLHRLFVWSNSLTGPPTTGSAAGLSVPRPGGRRRHRDAESWYSLLDALNCCLLNIISRADLIAMMTIIQNTSTCCLFLSRTLSSDTTAGTALRVFKIARYPDAANSHAVRA